MVTVWTNGCFDVLHFGHFESLRRARDLGDRLIVGLNTDDSVRRLKGSSRPIHNENQRMTQLLSLRFVDEVIFFFGDTPCDIISELKPDVIVKGPGYSPTNMPEASIVNAYGGKIVILNGPEISTTKILDRMKERT